MKHLRFNIGYCILTIIFFIIEILIALYVRDNFVRPYLGDYLVVILVYCAVRTLVKGNVVKIAAGVLLFAYCIEWLQYCNIVTRLGLEQNQLARTVIGTGFEWWDILAYTLGIITVVLIESLCKQEKIDDRPNSKKSKSKV